jgi:adenosine deaminase
MIEVARDHELALPHKDVDQLRSLVQVQDGEPFTHQNFLSKFETLRKFYQSPEVIKRIAREIIADGAADNIRYMELRFTPVALTRINGYPLGDAMDWVIEATQEAAKEYGVMTRLIASINRHESPELGSEVSECAIERLGRGIVGLDLAGNETDFPALPFAESIKKAKEAGLKITVHAGEWSGAENVAEAIQVLGADRIGHGVRVLEDEATTELAREHNTAFEVCITSNYQSGVTPSLDAHPLPEMVKAGLNVTINTDDPSLSQIDLSDEFEVACEDLGLTFFQLRGCILNAARSAFLLENEREELLESLDKELTDKCRHRTDK